jgi:hypothetical protein
MSFNLVLNNKNAIAPNSFQYNFPQVSFTIPEGSEIGVSQIILPYSWVNVSSALGNNTLTYYIPNSSNTQVGYTLTLADGFYTVAQLNLALQALMRTNGHFWYDGVASTVTGQTVQFIGTISGTTLTVPNNNAILFVGYVISYYTSAGALVSATITAVTNSTTYTISSATGNVTTVPIVGMNGNEITPDIIYPITISTNQSLYTNTITSITIPTFANIQSVFGFYYRPADGLNGQPNWTGGYATSGNQYGYVVFPTTNSTTNTLGNLLGFSSDGSTSYPTSGTTSALSVSVNGNSLSATPAFAPKGSSVNGICIRCNLVENKVAPLNDLLDIMPINNQYGSNLLYAPQISKFVKIRAGKYSNITITFNDDNFKTLNMLDQNVLICLLIKFKE